MTETNRNIHPRSGRGSGKAHALPLNGELANTWTHLAGVVFALSSIWMAWPAVYRGWEWAFGVIFFISGMFLMFLSSTLYHWVWPGKVKQVMRKLDHIHPLKIEIDKFLHMD